MYAIRSYYAHLIDQSKAGYFPKIDAVTGFGHERIRTDGEDSTSMTRQELGVTLSQMIFDGFATSSDLKRTKAEASAQRYALMAQARITSYNVCYTKLLRVVRLKVSTTKNSLCSQ